MTKPDILPCTIKSLPAHKVIGAAQSAVKLNPANHPPAHVARTQPTAFKLALIVGRRWPASGIHLTVSFMDTADAALIDKILSHMNAWGEYANVEFAHSQTGGDVRIARDPDGYWSYLGTDIQHIPAGEPTMNLEAFSLDTPDSEFYRVVRHETGHTLGFPHEHLRRTLVNRIDPKKAIAYFGATQGWSAADVRAQVLTPLEAVKMLKTYRVDERSVMCYFIPGAITRSGRPIIGGTDITAMDAKFAASVYPKP